jgi:succinate dehydrogenase / fumarate reductase iron-sulfur subunit
MIEAMDEEGFGNCTMHRECEAVCPKAISVNFIARMNREYLRSLLKGQGLTFHDDESFVLNL